MGETEVFLDSPRSTIFKYVQQLMSCALTQGRGDKYKRVWEPTYT